MPMTEMTSTPGTTPRASKRPERGIWQGGRLSAKKAEPSVTPPQPASKNDDRKESQLETSPTRSASSSPTRQRPSNSFEQRLRSDWDNLPKYEPGKDWSTNDDWDIVPNSEPCKDWSKNDAPVGHGKIDQQWKSEAAPTRSRSSSPVRRNPSNGDGQRWDRSEPCKISSKDEAPVGRGRTDQQWKSEPAPTRSTSSSPVRQHPSTPVLASSKKSGPYKIDFWWAPPPNSETSARATATSNRESSPKPESKCRVPSPTRTPKSNSPVEPSATERGRDIPSKPETSNIAVCGTPSLTPMPRSCEPIESGQNQGNSTKSEPICATACGTSSSIPAPCPTPPVKSSTHPNKPSTLPELNRPVISTNSYHSTNRPTSSESNRSATSPQLYHTSPSPESNRPVTSTQPCHPSMPESPTISLGEISHSSSEPRSSKGSTPVSQPALRFVHPLPPKPSPPPKSSPLPKPSPHPGPSLVSLQASNPYSNIFPTSTSAANPTSTSVPSPTAEYKFSGTLRPPPSTSNPGDAYRLISRCGVDEEKSSLLTIGAQMGLFVWIRQEVAAVKNLTDSRDANSEETEKGRISRLHHLVDTIRKLREGVRAANKLDDFAVEVYELSVSTCLIPPLHREELHRSLRVLCDVLYTSKPRCKNELRYLSVDLLSRLQGGEEDIALAHCRLAEAIKRDGEGNEDQRAVAEAVVDIRIALAVGDYVGFGLGCKVIQDLDMGVLVRDLLPAFRLQTLEALKKAYIFIPIKKLAGYMLLDPERHVPYYMPTADGPPWNDLINYLAKNGIDPERRMRGDVVHLQDKIISRIL